MITMTDVHVRRGKKVAPAPEPFSFRVTILVPKDVPPARLGAKKSSGSSKFDFTSFVQKDPFKFPSDGSYQAFLAVVSQAMKCSVNLIQPKTLQYKLKVPQTSPILAMGSSVCFEALIDDVTNKTANKRDVFLLSPPPIKLDAYEAVYDTVSFVLFHAHISN